MLTLEQEIILARGAVMSFSPEEPLFVGPAMYRSIVEAGHFDDILDRVRVMEMDLVRASR